MSGVSSGGNTKSDRPTMGTTRSQVTPTGGDFSRQLEAVYRKEGTRMWRALFAFSGDAEIAHDAVAEAFAQALRRGAAVRHPERWVWRTAYRIAAGQLQQRSVTTRPTYEVLQDAGFEAVELVEVLAELSPQQRATVVLYHWAGYRVTEIARILGTAQSTVRVHLTRGRRRLRRLLSEGERR